MENQVTHVRRSTRILILLVGMVSPLNPLFATLGSVQLPSSYKDFLTGKAATNAEIKALTIVLGWLLAKGHRINS